MSTCSFSIRFSGNINDVVEKARAAISSQGGTFSGDASAGSFSVNFMGSIEGAYTIAGSEMNVEISSKPIFISCKQIESFMATQFAG